MNITYLGPAGVTFSAIAYDVLAQIFSVPKSDHPDAQLALAKSNEEILPLILYHGGFGAIAMETRAEGRVDPPINSFIELLKKYNGECPLKIMGAVKMVINFALMTKPGLKIGDIKKVIAHPKALGACRGNLKALKAVLVESPSNGQAADDASRSNCGDGVAALGPIQAANNYGLDVISREFEDREAVTTFYLLGHAQRHVLPRVVLRNLLVFRVKHAPGALVRVLLPYAELNINLRLIHSVHVENGVYHFAIETESQAEDNEAHNRAIERSIKCTDRFLQFGPFPIMNG